jgi:hypothetical protein
VKKNCWEVKRCGKEQDCPAYREKRLDGVHNGKNGGRSCWVVAGTLCFGQPSGEFAKKFTGCEKCDFYDLVKREEFPKFSLAVPLLAKLQDKN